MTFGKKLGFLALILSMVLVLGACGKTGLGGSSSESTKETTKRKLRI